MTADATSSRRQRARDEALRTLAASATSNIPGVDFASITLHGDQQSLRTIAATDPLAEQADALQYELREGPCYAAVTHERLALVNDVAGAPAYPSYGPEAARLGVRSQAAVQLINHEHQTASLNLYSRRPEAFDPSTILWTDLFGTQLAALLDYVEQVEQLNEALHSRTDIGTAIGILMERYGIDRNRAFGFLVRNSRDRNIKVRVLAQHIIDGTFQSTSDEDARSHDWP